MFPIGEEGQSKLGSAKSLRCLKHVDAFVEVEGAIEALVKIIREGPSICPTATKASLSCVFFMISGTSDKIKSRFVELGLVSLLLEMLVDAEKSLYERALGFWRVGCSDGIKDKVTELLKLFNLHISKLDCVDSSMDFKYLKRVQF
ncbi:hypothetical protein M0R45_001670 [Rubus argutus]|uniref:U-box domain-containing protein n=1 Tax=Rubus argutus TaxID=59490 RepID=A0AAW1VL68_RUBAR